MNAGTRFKGDELSSGEGVGHGVSDARTRQSIPMLDTSVEELVSRRERVPRGGRKVVRLMCMTERGASEGRQSDQEIDFRFGGRPAVRDCGVKACCKRECPAGCLGTSRPTGVSVIVGDFDLALCFLHVCSRALS